MIYLLLIYFLFLLAYAVFSFFAIYHLNRFGYVGDLTKPAIVLYLIAVFIILTITLAYIFTRSWPANFSL